VVTKDKIRLFLKSVRGRKNLTASQIKATNVQIRIGTKKSKNALKINIDFPKISELEIELSRKQSKLMMDSDVGVESVTGL